MGIDKMMNPALRKISKIGIFIILIQMLSSCTSPNNDRELFDLDSFKTTIFFDTEFIHINSIKEPISDSSVFKDDSFTISFWIYPVSNHNWSTLLSLGDENNFLILTTKGNPDGNDSGLNLAIRKNGGDIIRVLSNKSNTVDLHKFNHIAFSKNESSILLYLNGELIAENTIGYNLDFLSDFPLNIATKSLFGDPFTEGLMSNITYSSKALANETISDNYKTYYLATILELVDINETEDLTDNVKLLNFENSQLLNGLFSINWSSSNETLITSEGILNKAYPLTYDENVTLTLEISDGAQSASKDFFFTVRLETPDLLFDRDVAFLQNTFSNIYSESDYLPTELPNGTSIKWFANDQTVEIINNRIVKSSGSSDYLNITLNAKIHNDTKEKIISFPILVVDEYKAYLMSYFDEIDYEMESMKLAYSIDGIN